MVWVGCAQGREVEEGGGCTLGSTGSEVRQGGGREEWRSALCFHPELQGVVFLL